MLVWSFTCSQRGKAEKSAIPNAEVFLTLCIGPELAISVFLVWSGDSGSSVSLRLRTEGLLLWYQSFFPEHAMCAYGAQHILRCQL